MPAQMKNHLTEVKPPLAADDESGQSWEGSAIVTNLLVAERLLDQNEVRGCRNQKLTILGPSLFLIQWQ